MPTTTAFAIHSSSTIDPADDMFTTLRFPADVRSRGETLIRQYAPRIGTPELDRQYRRFSAFIHQAEAYYCSAKTLPYTSSALLYYYAFLNLAKAALAARAIRFNENHGLTPRYGQPPHPLADLQVRLYDDGIFQALYHVMFATAIARVQFSLAHLLGYVSEVEDQYVQATAQEPRVNRYNRLRFLSDHGAQTAWLLVAIPKSFSPSRHAAPVQAAFSSRFRPVTLTPGRAREIFDLLVPAYSAFDYFESITATATTPPPAPGFWSSEIHAALPNCIHPVYVGDDSEFVLSIHCPADLSDWPMNELAAIYLTMFFMGSLVRYRPDLLTQLLGTEAAWLLESFVNAAPLLFMRLITPLILNQQLIYMR